jgi:copper chaperone CopZ
MNTTVFIIGNMSCEHCASSVRQAIEALPCVEQVEVSLKKAEARVISSAPMDINLVSQAVEEAGFAVEGVR